MPGTRGLEIAVLTAALVATMAVPPGIAPAEAVGGGSIVYATTLDPASDEQCLDASDLAVTDESGSTVTRLTATGDVVETQPAWSPDGTWVVYAAGHSPMADQSWSDLRVVGFDGQSGRTLLGQGPVDEDVQLDVQPAWSPDGGRIAFARLDLSVQYAPWVLHAVAPDGGGLTALTGGQAATTAPAWSPDGTRMAYVVDDVAVVWHEVAGERGVVVFDVRDLMTGPDDTWPRVTEPAWSPDGGRIAFVLDEDQDLAGSAIWVAGADGSDPHPLTGADAEVGGPTWSPDGSRIAYAATPLDEDEGYDSEIVVMGADGSDVRAITDNDCDDTDPAWTAAPFRPGLSRLQRVAGPDRIATAIEVSRQLGDSASVVVLARADAFPDALAGGPLARHRYGPLLLTNRDGLDPRTAAEMQRVLGHGDAMDDGGAVVYLLGGTAALSPTVESAVAAMGYQPVRLGGADRFETAVAIAREIATDAWMPDVFLATGGDFPDALVAGAAAAHEFSLLLLTTGDELAEPTRRYLEDEVYGLERVIAVGADAAAAASAWEPVWGASVLPIAGATPYETARLMAEHLTENSVQADGPPTAVGLASGETFPDGLTAGPHLADLEMPLLLVGRDGETQDAAGYVADNPSVQAGFVYGGTAAISPSVAAAVEAVMR